MKYFHVTTARALPVILTSGLLPQIGERAEEYGETIPAVYVFNSIGTCEDALMNWLGDTFDEDTPIVVIELELKRDIICETEGFETRIFEKIPASAITRVLDESLQAVST